MRDDRDLLAVQRDPHLLAGQASIPGVVGVDHHRATGREQLRARRRDRQVASAGEDRELHPDEARGAVFVLDVRLGEGRLAHRAPEGRAFPAVEESFRPKFEEDRLTEGAVFVRVRVVRVCEIGRQPHADRYFQEPVPDCLDLLAAFRDEGLPVPSMERLAGLLLDRPLDVDPVPIEAEREEHGPPEHPVRSGDHVDHRVRHDGPDVPRAARIRRRGVDHVDGLPTGRGERIQIGFRLPGR